MVTTISMKNKRFSSTIFLVIGIIFFTANLLIDTAWQYREHNSVMQMQGTVLQQFIKNHGGQPPDIFDIRAVPTDSALYSFKIITDTHGHFLLPETSQCFEKIRAFINTPLPDGDVFIYASLPCRTEYIFLRVIVESVDDNGRNLYRCCGITIPSDPHFRSIYEIIEAAGEVIEVHVTPDDTDIPWCIIAYQHSITSPHDALQNGLEGLLAQRMVIQTSPVSSAGFAYEIVLASKKGILSFINLAGIVTMIMGCVVTYIISGWIGKQNMTLFMLRNIQQRRNAVIESNGVYSWEYNIATRHYTLHDPLNSVANHAHWRDAIDPQDREKVLSLFNGCVNGNTGDYSTVFRYTAIANKTLWIREQGRIISRRIDGAPLVVGGVLLDVTASVHTNEKLADEINFRKAIERSINSGIICLDLNDVHTYVNASFLAMTGFTKEEILGIKFPTAYFPVDSTDDTKEIFSALFSGTAGNGPCEVTLMQRNGKRFPALLSISRLSDHTERHTGWVGTIIDLTEVKKNKLLSADIQNKYQVIFESIPVGIVHQNEQGEIIESNATAKEILQLPHHNFITALTNDAPHSARIRCIRENGGEFTRDELPSSIALITGNKVENVIIGFQDDLLQETVWMNVSAIPDGIGGDGRVIGTYTMFQNITNMRKYQIQTEKSEREFRALAQNASVGVFRVNRRLQLLFANDALIAIADYDSLEQFVECGGIGSLVKDKKKIFTGFRILLRHGSIKNHKMFITSNKGVEKWLLFNATFVDDKIYGTFIDITATEQLQKQLEQERDALSKRVQERTKELTDLNSQLLTTSNIKDDFLSTISHELRTPFNSILTLTEALTEGIYGPLTINQINKLNLIIQSGRHLLSLINDLLDLSKINAGKFELEYSSVNLHDMLGMAFTMLSEDINKKNLNVDFKTDGEPAVIVADERRMRQIIINLLGNAIKFTKEKGTIGADIQIDEERKLVTINVRDTGIGIQQDKINNLFTTFSQIDSSLSRNYQGTGLGLALVKKLTELQGGSVSVQSTYGVGSTFSVTIPKQHHAPADVVSTDAPTVSVQPATVEKRKKSILIVDDNEVTAFNVKDYLDNYGFKTSVAFTGVEAINKAAENPPDVMLVDIQMPGIDGIEVIRTIRSNPVTRQIKIIAVTALAMPGDRERCLWAGADDHMRKPVELKKLILLIDRYSMR